MKSRRNSNNKAKKKIFVAKTVKDIKLQFTGKGFRPVFTETELPIGRKTF